MRVLLFEDGGSREVALPGEWPEEELEELLGGEIETEPLAEGLDLVRLADGWLEALPCRYELWRLDREAELIAGDCAVVRADQTGRWEDILPQDGETAEEYIRRVAVR